MKSDKFKGSFLLLLAALIWGSSFIVMKSAVDFLTPNVLLFVRFTLETLVMYVQPSIRISELLIVKLQDILNKWLMQR